MSNTMQALRLYRHQGTWAFDDTRHDLDAEPFVLGAEELIDTMLKDQGLWPCDSVTVYFSLTPFPGATSFLKMEEVWGGCWYMNERYREGWLCPAGRFYSPDEWPEEFWAAGGEHG